MESYKLIGYVQVYIQFCSVAQSCLTLCDPMDYSMPGFPVRQLLELVQTHVNRVGDAIQPFHPLSSNQSESRDIFMKAKF